MSKQLPYEPEPHADEATLPPLDSTLLQALVANSGEVIAVLTDEVRYLYVSPAVRDSLGWEPSELVGRCALEVIHPDDVAEVEAAVQIILAPPYPRKTLRFRFAQRDNQWRLMESSAQILARNGQAPVIVAHSRDITDQEKISQALRDSEERYRQLIENSPDAVIAHTQGVIVYANSAAAELFACESAEALIGHRAAEIIHPDDLPGMRERVQLALSKGRHAPLREERMVRLNGEEIWVEAKGVLTNINGQPSIQAVIRDVTQRRNSKLAEQRRASATRMLYEIASQSDIDTDHQLQQALALAASLLNMESALISECDATTCFVAHHYGPAHTNTKGVSYPLGQTYCAIPMATGKLVAIADLSNSEYAKHPAVRKLPQKSYIAIPLRLRDNAPGEHHGVLGFSSAAVRPQDFDEVDRDLLRIMSRWVEFALERKSAGQALAAVNRDLSRSNEELQQFAYIASHDLKEPLRSVTTYLQLLERRYRDQLNEEAREFMDFAVSGALRMQNLIQDLLEFSRVGTYSDEARQVCLQDVAAQALASLSNTIESTQAQINTATLPNITGHEGLLLQLLQNLISNALKYRRKDIAPVIYINAETTPEHLRVNVCDNGIGVAPEHRERVFQMFRRLHNHEEYEGTGIGLAIAKRIVERHGGDIGVEASSQGGSCFFFTLPVA